LTDQHIKNSIAYQPWNFL